jgi:hypothetical protein
VTSIQFCVQSIRSVYCCSSVPLHSSLAKKLKPSFLPQRLSSLSANAHTAHVFEVTHNNTLAHSSALFVQVSCCSLHAALCTPLVLLLGLQLTAALLSIRQAVHFDASSANVTPCLLCVQQVPSGTKKGATARPSLTAQSSRQICSSSSQRRCMKVKLEASRLPPLLKNCDQLHLRTGHLHSPIATSLKRELKECIHYGITTPASLPTSAFHKVGIPSSSSSWASTRLGIQWHALPQGARLRTQAPSLCASESIEQRSWPQRNTSQQAKESTLLW